MKKSKLKIALEVLFKYYKVFIMILPLVIYMIIKNRSSIEGLSWIPVIVMGIGVVSMCIHIGVTIANHWADYKKKNK